VPESEKTAGNGPKPFGHLPLKKRLVSVSDAISGSGSLSGPIRSCGRRGTRPVLDSVSLSLTETIAHILCMAVSLVPNLIPFSLCLYNSFSST
jgi:hypothetical protein